MKRITFLLVAFLATIGINNLYAKSTASIPSYFCEQYFTNSVAYPTNWADATSLIGSNNAGVSWTSPASNQINVAGSGSGTRGRSISFPTSGTESMVYVDFDFFVTASMIGSRNALGILLHDNSGNNILSLYSCGSDAKWHYWNIEKDSTTFAGGSFNRASTSVTVTNTRNFGSQLDFAYATGSWFNIKATLNFTSKIVESMVLTKKSDGTSITSLNQPFLNAAATDVTKISLVNTRSSNAGNGSNANLNISIDNFKTYKLIDVTTTSVNINYKDASGNTLKASRIQTDLEIGTTYTVPATDKATFADASNYYSYDAVATLADNVVVAEGAEINLVFKITPLTAGTYTWTGVSNSYWNNGDSNFTTDGVNSIGYQDNNPIIFPSTATNKLVDLNAELTIGTNDITLSGDAYSISGTGSIAGAGKIILNLSTGETATMGIKNNMAGGVTLNGGTATITNDLGTAAYTVADGAKLILQSGATYSKSITGSGTLNIEAASNNYYWMPITGASTVNIQLNNAGSGTSATWSDYFGGSFPSGAQINVTTGLAAAGFGVVGGLLTNSKVSLGDGVRLLHWYNQSSSGGGTSYIYVGELNGTASSTVEGGMVDANNRHLAYEIGALNTDATFNGVIKNFGTVTQANLNIYKKGNGVWTLNGISPYSPGLFNVDMGTVILNGSLTGAAVSVTVAPGATLKGTGTIAGPVTINGILEGNLNFSGTLALTGTTKFVVNGVNDGEFDVIDVVGNLNLGGTVEVTVNTGSGAKGVDKVRNANPPVGTRIKLFNAGSITTTLSPIHFPSSGWTFIPESGELVYDPSNVVTGLGNNGVEFRIFPTITRDNIHVEGNVNTIEVMNLAGQRVKQLKANGTKTVVNMNNLSAGAYLVKALMIDGSVKVQNVILQK